MTKSFPKFLLFLCCCAAFAGAAGELRVVRAYEVTAVKILAEDAGGYQITVAGRMRTGGHTNPRMRRADDVKQGELVLELVADAPSPGAMVAMVLQPVSATFRMSGGGVKFIRVVSKTNEIRRPLP
jgi:hypothetical protein